MHIKQRKGKMDAFCFRYLRQRYGKKNRQERFS